MTVRQIQHLLAYLGYYALAVDGVWGEGSEAACREFQEAAHIGTDGIPGHETQAALKEAVAQGHFRQAEGAVEDDAAFWATISNFEKVEFTCHCGCGLNNVDHRLVRLCQKVRDHFGAAFVISSPCRCEANNRKAGGVSNSRHLYGRAVDFRIAGKTAAQVMAYIAALPETAYCYAIDAAYVHMDIV